MAILRQAKGEKWYRFVKRVGQQFKRMAARTPDPESRLALLQAMAEVRISDWGNKRPESVRKRYMRRRTRVTKRVPEPLPCFVCKRPSRARHHVMQLQHGGGNHPHNKVPICPWCHARIHPWLEVRTA